MTPGDLMDDDWWVAPYSMIGSAHAVSSEPVHTQPGNPIGFIWPERAAVIVLPEPA